jgi:hypothetical protein
MIILAALFFGLITLGFTLLTVVPFVFLFLWLGVSMEPHEALRDAQDVSEAPAIDRHPAPVTIAVDEPRDAHPRLAHAGGRLVGVRGLSSSLGPLESAAEHIGGGC